MELVNYCSSRIFESLSEDNALEIGMFGEMHNSEVIVILLFTIIIILMLVKDKVNIMITVQVLIHSCAKFICYDMTDSLAEDWMDRIQESPRLMLEVTIITIITLVIIQNTLININ